MGTEPSADAVRPVDRSKRWYFAVITSFGFAMGLLPSLFIVEAELHVIIPYEVGSVSAPPWWLFQAIYIAEFLISPCLFFVVLYLYGKRKARNFDGSYLRVILLLFVSSALGYAVFWSSLPYLEGSTYSVLTWTYWLQSAFSIVSEGVRDTFAGFAALGLSYLGTRNLANPTVPAWQEGNGE